MDLVWLRECIADRRKLHPPASSLAFLQSAVHLADVVSQKGYALRIAAP
jgi:hypothetical protein